MPTKPKTKRRRYPWKKRADPWPFIFAAAKLPGKALHVATALLLQGLVDRSTVLEWDAHYGEHLGLTYATFYRGLRTLEAAGLVGRRSATRPSAYRDLEAAKTTEVEKASAAMRRRQKSKRRRGGVLPPGTYRKWAELFRPELLERNPMKTTEVAIATNGGSAQVEGVYVGGTERLVAVTAEPLNEFERRIGRKARWVITHVRTGMGISHFADKGRAIQVASELFDKLPLSFWQSQHAAELTPPREVVAWLKTRKVGE